MKCNSKGRVVFTFITSGTFGSGQVYSPIQKHLSMACFAQDGLSGAGDTEMSVIKSLLSSTVQVLMTSYHSDKKCYNSLTLVHRQNGFRSMVKKILQNIKFSLKIVKFFDHAYEQPLTGSWMHFCNTRMGGEGNKAEEKH